MIMARKRTKTKGKPAVRGRQKVSSRSKGLKKKRPSRASYMREWRKQKVALEKAQEQFKYEQTERIKANMLFGLFTTVVVFIWGGFWLNGVFVGEGLWLMWLPIWLICLILTLDIIRVVGKKRCARYLS